jgi:hypothetical protein
VNFEQLGECAYKGITVEGCNVAESFMAPNSNGTCTEKPDLDMGKIIADVSTAIGYTRGSKLSDRTPFLRIS